MLRTWRGLGGRGAINKDGAATENVVISEINIVYLGEVLCEFGGYPVQTEDGVLPIMQKRIFLNTRRLAPLEYSASTIQ